MTYTGQRNSDGRPHGLGTMTSTDGTTYIGQWKDSLPHGQGTATYYSGDTYTGEWKDGERVP